MIREQFHLKFWNDLVQNGIEVAWEFFKIHGEGPSDQIQSVRFNKTVTTAIVFGNVWP